jgi:alkanesulfonate monooxygenase
MYPPASKAASAALFRRLVRTPADRVAADHVDVYLTWGEPPHLTSREKIAEARALAAERGRTCRSASACM